jgi:hypothetical protein
VLEGLKYETPKPMQLPRGEQQGRGGNVKICPAICQFNVQDFTPSAKEPNPYLRQAVGKYLQWLRNYGEEMCLLPPTYLHQMSLETGCPLPNSNLSPSDYIRVDKRAFPRAVHIHVKLVVLGYDPELWGDLQHFRSLMVDRYYQEITGSPILSIDFRDNIGNWEVCACDTLPADS